MSAAPPPCVLGVEDDEQFRAFLCDLLTSNGYQVVEGADGEEGALVFRSTDPRPVAVVTDLMMPNKEGLALIGELRDEHPSLPLIAISGHGGMFGERYLRAASALGASATLHKPFDPQQLITTLGQLGAPPGSIPPSDA